MWLWLRRRFLTGFFVTVPLFISVAALVWIFGVVDGLTTPLYDRVLGRRIPGLGTLSTVMAIMAVGVVRPSTTPKIHTSAATLMNSGTVTKNPVRKRRRSHSHIDQF